MSNITLLALLLTIPFLAVIVRLVRQRKLRAKYSFLWLLVGGAVLVLAVTPGMLDAIGQAAGIAYPPALIFLGAIMLLMFIAVHFSWELSRIEDRMRTLAEELALANEQIERLQTDRHPTPNLTETRLEADRVIRA